MRYRHLIHPEYGSTDVKYSLYNFHRDADLDLMTSLLSDGGVAIVAGRSQSGRRYFLQAACHRYRRSGHDVAYLPLDLEGFEPDHDDALVAYVEHAVHDLRDKDEAQRQELTTALRGLVVGLEKTFFKASLLSLILRFDQPAQKLTTLLESQHAEDLAGPRRSGAEVVSRFLAELAAEQRLLVHVTDNAELTITQRSWLLGEARKGHILLAISCRPEDENEDVASAALTPVVRFDLTPLDPAEVRTQLDARFTPNDFPADLAKILWMQTDGKVPNVALRVFDLVHEDALVEDDAGWHLPPGGVEAPAVVAVFKRDVYGSIQEILDAPDKQRAVELEHFLLLGSLCGRNVPVKLILEHMALNEDACDAVEDLVDDFLVEDDDLPLFEDLGANHPSFPETAIYRFRHPLLYRAIQDQLTPLQRSNAALQLLAFLTPRLPVASRSHARLFQNLCEHVQSEERRAEYVAKLSWWIGIEETEILTDELVACLESGRLTGEAVWTVIEGSLYHWPPYRRMAVLEAYARQPGGVPLHSLGGYHFYRGQILVDLGHFRDALEEGRLAANIFEGGNLGDHGAALQLCVQVLRQLGDLDGARKNLERLLEITASVFGTQEHPHVAASLYELAGVLQDQGDLDGAQKNLERVLEINASVFGTQEHPYVATSLHALATVLHAQGELGGARKNLERVLEINASVFGTQEHPHVASSLHTLAIVLQDQGDLEGARKNLERSLEIYASVFGTQEHPDVATSLHRLANVLKDQGDLDSARKNLEHSLEIQGRCYGTREHYKTAETERDLGRLLQKLDEPEAGQELLTHAHQVFLSQLGPEHPLTRSLKAELGKG